ncbi:MAG: MATE family efflux transporter [Clostridia bacterium]|nr:MATE family efflux transporter [Clostridia bacterium]
MLFSRKDLSKIIIPLFIEQTLAITVGMFDSVMVSSVGEAAVSGVSLVDTLNLLLIYLFTALAGGGAVVISQLIGQKDYKRANEASKQLLYIVFIVACALTLLATTLRTPLLKLIFGSIEKDVMEHAKIYFLFTALSYPFFGIYSACASVFRAMGNSSISMRISLAMNIINIGGNALLIYVFNMGAAGAAIATLFSRIVGAVIILILTRNPKNQVYIEKPFSYKISAYYVKRICGIGIPNGLENGMFQFGKVLTQSLISSFGTIHIAANAVANSLTALQYIPGTAIGLTMVVVVGRCVGAGEKEQAKAYSKKLLGITYVAILAISAILCSFSTFFVGMYNLSAQSTALAKQLIFFHSICVCTIWPIAFPLTNAFRAANDVKFTMIISVASMWIFRVGLSFVFAKVTNIGVPCVWIAMSCDWIFRTIIFGIRYLKGSWLKKAWPNNSLKQ